MLLGAVNGDVIEGIRNQGGGKSLNYEAVLESTLFLDGLVFGRHMSLLLKTSGEDRISRPH